MGFASFDDIVRVAISGAIASCRAPISTGDRSARPGALDYRLISEKMKGPDKEVELQPGLSQPGGEA
jgi:hypothetical protein